MNSEEYLLTIIRFMWVYVKPWHGMTMSMINTPKRHYTLDQNRKINILPFYPSLLHNAVQLISVPYCAIVNNLANCNPNSLSQHYKMPIKRQATRQRFEN